jgi:rRNA maturation protein Nop10
MININREMPNSCADCFACGMHDITHAFRCRLTGEELLERQFYDLLTKKNPRMKNCPLQEEKNSTTLKPCPFCGSAVEIQKKPLWRTNSDGSTHGYYNCYTLEIVCFNCGCSTFKAKSDTVYRTEEEAKREIIKNWNHRKGEKND